MASTDTPISPEELVSKPEYKHVLEFIELLDDQYVTYSVNICRTYRDRLVCRVITNDKKRISLLLHRVGREADRLRYLNKGGYKWTPDIASLSRD